MHNYFEERQSLAQLYRAMGDVELCELDADRESLTAVAQEVLRNEMSTRQLDRPPVPLPGGIAGFADGDRAAEEGEHAQEFTWKTTLCDCNDGRSAARLQAALRAEGIESWLEGSGYQIAAETLNPRVLVAADQLELARQIADRPIPQSILEESEMEMPEYEPPVCPHCGADDPILVDADPVNRWLCESCNKEWTETAEDASQFS